MAVTLLALLKARAVAAQQHHPARCIAQQGTDACAVEAHIGRLEPPDRLAGQLPGLLRIADAQIAGCGVDAQALLASTALHFGDALAAHGLG